MLNRKKRGLLATAGALVTAAALALSGAAAANAAPVEDMPDISAVVITKSSSAPGTAANGLPETVTNPIKDVEFEAYAVPIKGGTPAVDLVPGSNAWQQAVAAMTPASAAALVDFDVVYRSGTTDANGVIVWADDDVDGVAPQAGSLARGLYLIRETGAPAGVVPSNDFLIAVPLTHPIDLNAWLDTIYVYPKNRTVEGTKTVANATDYVVGDTVTWTIDIDNPSPRDNATGTYLAADKFLVLDTIKDEYLTSSVAGVNVTVPASLTKGASGDYTVTLVAGTGNYDEDDNPTGNDIAVGYTQIQVNFTAAGLTKLASQMNTANNDVDNVVMTVDTVVNKVGVIENSAQFFSSEAQTDPKDVPGTSVKYGNVILNKKSTKGSTDLSGATFRVYLSEDDAKAKNNNYLTPAQSTPANTAYDGEGLWTTDADGSISLGGFRYSGYADGAEIQSGETGYQTYWLAEIKALDGHQLLGEPVPFTVGNSTDTNSLTVLEYDVTNSADGGFKLPLTGGTGTLLLTILGAGILAVVLVVARRRNTTAAAE